MYSFASVVFRCFFFDIRGFIMKNFFYVYCAYYYHKYWSSLPPSLSNKREFHAGRTGNKLSIQSRAYWRTQYLLTIADKLQQLQAFTESIF